MKIFYFALIYEVHLAACSTINTVVTLTVTLQNLDSAWETGPWSHLSGYLDGINGSGPAHCKCHIPYLGFKTVREESELSSEIDQSCLMLTDMWLAASGSCCDFLAITNYSLKL